MSVGTTHRRPRTLGPALAGLALAALALTSCSGSSGGGAGGTGSTSAAGTTTATASPTTSSASPTSSSDDGGNGGGGASPAAAIVSLKDLPSGWAKDPDSSITSNFTTKQDAPVTPKSCSKAAARQQNFNFAATPAGSAHADFINAKQGRVIGATIYTYGAKYPAGELKAIKATFAKCGKYSEVDDGSRTLNQITTFEVPKLGDQTLGFRVTGTADVGVAYQEILLVRDGKRLVMVDSAAIGAFPDRAQLVQLMQKTLHRLG